MNDTLTVAQRAEALEAKAIRELDEAIIVKSRLFMLADADFSWPNGAALQAEKPGAKMLMGDDPRLPKMPDKPTLVDFFKYRFGPAQHLLQSAKHALTRGAQREDGPCLPAARYRGDRLYPLRPRLLGRADRRALCRRGSDLGDPRAPGAALLRRRGGRLCLSRPCTSSCSARTTSPSPISRTITSGRANAQMVHDGAPDPRQRHLFVRPERRSSSSTSSRTSSAATSSSRRKASASTTARPRICGGR